MKSPIRIQGKLHPFSHLPGAVCLVPKTSIEVQIFPCLIRLRDLNKSAAVHEYSLNAGELKQFTVELDLEGGLVRVWGEAAQGYLRYRIYAKERALFLELERGPAGLQFGSTTLKKGAPTKLRDLSQPVFSTSQEKLSLGKHRLQDWDQIKARADLAELLPACYALSQQSFSIDRNVKRAGVLKLLDQLREQISQKNKLEVDSILSQIFQVGFQGILSPRIYDENFLGILPFEPLDKELSSTLMLTELGQLVRSLFFQASEKEVSFLPCLPPGFHSGRFIRVKWEGDEIDFEWSKKQLKQVVWRCNSKKQIKLHLPKPLGSFRARGSLRARGERKSALNLLDLPQATIYLDRFEKG